MFLERFSELRNNRDRQNQRRDPWFRLTPEPEREPASERSCADCGKNISGWKPAHPIGGVRGVFCTGCWIENAITVLLLRPIALHILQQELQSVCYQPSTFERQGTLRPRPQYKA